MFLSTMIWFFIRLQDQRWASSFKDSNLLSDPFDKVNQLVVSTSTSNEVELQNVDPNGVLHHANLDARVAPLLPLWAHTMIKNLSIQGTLPKWESKEGSWHLHCLKAHVLIGDLLSTNYALMSNREPTHVGEALKQDMWRQAMEAKIQSIEQTCAWDLDPRP